MNKYLNSGEDGKNLRNNKFIVILIVAGAFVSGGKNLKKSLSEVEIRRKIETVQRTAQLRPTRILKKSP